MPFWIEKLIESEALYRGSATMASCLKQYDVLARAVHTHYKTKAFSHLDV